MGYITRFSDMTNTALRIHTSTHCRLPQTRPSRTANGGFPYGYNTGGGASEDEEVAACILPLRDEMPRTVHTDKCYKSDDILLSNRITVA